MIDDLKEGDIVWTIALSIESESYEPQVGFIEPYQAKVNERETCTASRFNKETGIRDRDANATCFLAKNTTFATELEAWSSYADRMQTKMQEMWDEANEHMAKTFDSLKKVDELQKRQSNPPVKT